MIEVAQGKVNPQKGFVIKKIMPMPPQEYSGETHTRVFIKEEEGDNLHLMGGVGYSLETILKPTLNLSPYTGKIDHSYKALDLIWNVGAEHILGEKISFHGYTFESDLSYPLTFKLTKNGYTYLCGRGTVTTKDGKTYRLGYEQTVSTWMPRLNSKDPLDRKVAVQALGWLAKSRQDKEKTLPALIRALKDKKMEVRTKLWG